MTPIDWKPGPLELRRWGILMLVGTAIGGGILQVLLDRPEMARALWVFGAVSCVSALTCPKAGYVCYLLWMGFVWLVSSVLGTLAMGAVFFLVITPMGLVARLCGRDRLKLSRPAPGVASFWQPAPRQRLDRIDRPF